MAQKSHLWQKSKSSSKGMVCPFRPNCSQS